VRISGPFRGAGYRRSKDVLACYSVGTGWNVAKESYEYSELLIFGSSAKSSLRPVAACMKDRPEALYEKSARIYRRSLGLCCTRNPDQPTASRLRTRMDRITRTSRMTTTRSARRVGTLSLASLVPSWTLTSRLFTSIRCSGGDRPDDRLLHRETPGSHLQGKVTAFKRVRSRANDLCDFPKDARRACRIHGSSSPELHFWCARW